MSRRKGIRADAGFSLVELIMALFVLAFGVVGLATTTLFITRQLTLAEVTTARVAASAARVLLMAVVGYTLPLILGDALGWIAVGTDAYTLLGGLVTILGAWAGGPHAIQYLGPQVGAVLSRVGGGRRGYSGPEVSVRVGDNPATDDERG